MPAPQNSHPIRDRIAMVAMVLLGLSTLAAFANEALMFNTIPPDQRVPEAWRMLCYPMFAGLFILLGLFPRRLPGVWELVFYQKAGIAIFLAFFVKDAGGPLRSDAPSGVIAVDATLAAVTLISYVLSEGWRAWGSKAGG